MPPAGPAQSGSVFDPGPRPNAEQNLSGFAALTSCTCVLNGSQMFSYESLRDVESERLKVFDGEFKAVTKLRAQIDRRCLYASAGDERSLCVDKGIEINRKMKGLQARRAKAASAVERYDRMIAWCASYKNWFC